MTAALDMLQAVAAYGLNDAAARFPADPLKPGVWQNVLALAARRRLTGPLAAAVTSGDLPTRPRQRTAAVETHQVAAEFARELNTVRVDVVDRFDAADVPCRVLKGAAVAHLDHADPSSRTYGDIDLLVPGASIERARSLLEDLGGQRRYPEPRPGYDRRFGKGVCVVVGPHEIDLHRTLAKGPFGMRITADDLFDDSEEFTLLGHRLRALAPEARIMHAAIHGALGRTGTRLASERDLALLALKGIDPDLVLALARRWRCEAVLATALVQAWDDLQPATTPELVSWARARPLSRRDRSVLASYDNTTAGSARQAMLAILTVPGVRARFAYGAAVAFPKTRSAGRSERWRRAARGLLRARS